MYWLDIGFQKVQKTVDGTFPDYVDVLFMNKEF